MRAGKHRGSLDWEGGHRCSTGTKEALGEGQQRHAGLVWEHSPFSAHLLHLPGSILPAQHTGTSLTGAAAGRWGQEGHGQRAARGRTCKQDGGCARTAGRRRRGTGPAREVPWDGSWLVECAHLQTGQRCADKQLHEVHVVQLHKLQRRTLWEPVRHSGALMLEYLRGHRARRRVPGAHKLEWRSADLASTGSVKAAA